MKRLYFTILILCIAGMITFFSCPSPSSTREIDRESTYSGSGDEIFHIEYESAIGMINNFYHGLNYTIEMTHTLHLGSSTADVYYVFSNAIANTNKNHPVVENESNRAYIPESRFPLVYNDNSFIGLRGTMEISEFNEDVSSLLGSGTPRTLPGEVQTRDEEGDKISFYYNLNTTDTITATCRKVVDADYKTLYIYVADNCWEGSPTSNKSFEVNQTMVEAMADKFLQAGSDNDIYDWVSGIYGREWGPHPYVYDLIPDNNTITILLYDIGNDNIPSSPTVLGFFWAKDNFKPLNTADVEGTNGRLMFYIDAVLYACPEGGTWEIDDRCPNEIISTLAHEFQHMIHFYQKSIVTGNGGYNSESWINEMCAMAAEDFIADKMAADGPRGVAYNDFTAGASGNTQGRIPEFNYINDYSLTKWEDELYNYSTVYAFGSYLARNFGGAPLFSEIISNPYIDYQSINAALSAMGNGDIDFSTLLGKWGAAILLSDNDSQGGGEYQYNVNGAMISTISSTNYNLGSINLYNYDFTPPSGGGTQSGPYIYTTSPVGADTHSTFYSASNRLYLVGQGLTGDVERTIFMDDGITLTVVVKE